METSILILYILTKPDLYYEAWVQMFKRFTTGAGRSGFGKGQYRPESVRNEST